MIENTERPFLFFDPENFFIKENFTGKLDMFLISNSFTDYSPTKTLAKYTSPSSGFILTSGQTPLPLRWTEQTVNEEYTFNVSS